MSADTKGLTFFGTDQCVAACKTAFNRPAARPTVATPSTHRPTNHAKRRHMSVIPLAWTHLAFEDGVRVDRVAENHRHGNRGAYEKKQQARVRRGGIAERNAGRHEIGIEADQDTCITKNEDAVCKQQGQTMTP